ncbi:MAG TPA: CDP-alcohol phosphatidyltransferase family protein [Phycisphaerales bacterium]|nr:CDP-alcohol phosphatidyltransferase family protein [Phycisphaerales bacterium]
MTRDEAMNLNWANRITILRILLIIPFVSCMLKINDAALSDAMRNTMRYISIIIFLVMAASDGLDGFLARKKGQVTKFGAFLDPTADKLLITCACLLLASQRAGVDGFLLPPTVVVLIIGKDLFLLIGFVIVYFITWQVRIVPVLIGKIATGLQLSMVTAILLAPEISRFVPGWIWLLRVLWWSAAGTAILTTLIYIRNGSRYIEEYEQKNVSRMKTENLKGET